MAKALLVQKYINKFLSCVFRVPGNSVTNFNIGRIFKSQRNLSQKLNYKNQKTTLVLSTT